MRGRHAARLSDAKVLAGHRLKLLAVISAGPAVARFLRHLQLPAEPNDIDKVRGPPAVRDLHDDLGDLDRDPGDDIDLPFADWELAAASATIARASVETSA